MGNTQWMSIDYYTILASGISKSLDVYDIRCREPWMLTQKQKKNAEITNNKYGNWGNI